ncbi:hypothetical protein VTJ04DRAFT_6688 [Mycothermus thermophilus]|uniref:uncharacterized protein n=1 Tax=Humicola insolens TaxID=85995 RepID=UPI003743330A
MFANALKSIGSTNITANYSISQNLTAIAGPWKIYPAKNKKTGKECSVFVFDKKSLESHRGRLGRAEAAEFKRQYDLLIERLKKEASVIARLRHPGILEVVEPVEETRGGGLQFVSEAVTASLSGVLQEKDDQERGGASGRASRYVTEDADGNRRRREIEVDELEIQKGLLQVSKALEFMHENAHLVHGNLTPDAILINSKGDWKLSGMGFCSPLEGSSQTSIQPINLGEALRHTPCLPRSVQLNLDYTSPDFVIDKNLTASADMFTLGLLIIALYNSPHRSPISCDGSPSSYQRILQSSQTVPNPSNNFLSSRPLPKELTNHVLPRLITRRPAQRMTATEFQQSDYFNNILVSTIRFLDTFPAKTHNEKSQFLRGLVKVLPSFPKSVMEKKLLPALLEELKDKELVSLILHNVFKIIELLPKWRGEQAFGDKVRPALKEIFVTNVKQPQEKDPARDAGLMTFIEHLSAIEDRCGGKEFKDDILPIIFNALESPTPSLVDAALRSLPSVLPHLDFSTIKNELFPVVATIFARTSSLAIKVRGLEAFVTLCGGSNDPANDDGLDGLNPQKKKATSSTALDKFTMQEKLVPLIKNIKTKEPAVMMAALRVLKVVGDVADAEFVALDILPILWQMALGPLLNLKQFQAFMELIKTLSSRVEEEQTKKLQELAGTQSTTSALKDDFMSFGPVAGASLDANGATETDFESLVKGHTSPSTTNPLDAGWDAMSPKPSPGVGSGKVTPTVAFSWSTPPASVSGANSSTSGTKPSQSGSGFRTVTPDLTSIKPMSPTTTQFSQPLQPEPKTSTSSFSIPLQPQTASTSINWGAASTNNTSTTTTSSSLWSTPSTTTTQQPLTSAFGSLSLNPPPQQQQTGESSFSSFSLPPPPKPNTTTVSSPFSLPPPPQANATTGSSSFSGFSLAPPPGTSQSSSSSNFNRMGGTMGGVGLTTSTNTANASLASLMAAKAGGGTMSGNGMSGGLNVANNSQKSGLDKYESLL